MKSEPEFLKSSDFLVAFQWGDSAIQRGNTGRAEQKTIPHRCGIGRAVADFEELAELTAAGRFRAIVRIVGQTGLESLVETFRIPPLNLGEELRRYVETSFLRPHPRLARRSFGTHLCRLRTHNDCGIIRNAGRLQRVDTLMPSGPGENLWLIPCLQLHPDRPAKQGNRDVNAG